jgi:hypothetical protein
MFDFFKIFRSDSSQGALAGQFGNGDSGDARAASADEAPAPRSSKRDGGTVKVLKKGPAMRVIFFYPGEEGTYIDNAEVTLYENGIIHIKSHQEETTTHLQNCEILWRFETEAEDRANKVRLLKPKGHPRDEERGPPDRSPEA